MKGRAMPRICPICEDGYVVTATARCDECDAIDPDHDGEGVYFDAAGQRTETR